MAMKDPSRKVFLFLQGLNGQEVTLNEIATALDMAPRSVNGCLVGLQKKNLVVRTEVVEEVEGKLVSTKNIALTELASTYDIDAADVAK